MTPEPMRCEYPGCNSINVRDYKRKKKDQELGWEDEPIALCQIHSEDREAIPVNPFLKLPDNSQSAN
jgi:hypothetical protein